VVQMLCFVMSVYCRINFLMFMNGFDVSGRDFNPGRASDRQVAGSSLGEGLTHTSFRAGG
jgi:hypothetical protein